MVIETDILPFWQWLPWALLQWSVVVACAVVAAMLIGWLIAALRSGPSAALCATGRTLAGGAADLVRISPRRVLALSRLALQESIRRWVVVVFVVFVFVLLFAGWYLDPASAEPGRLYMSFVLTATGYLVLLLALFLSALSLPADIKNRTLHTIVTKPVRPSEIVLGRFLGFTAIGTLLLLVMGTISYVFVVRGLSHTHRLTEADLRPAEQSAGDQAGARKGLTDLEHGHRHRVSIDAAGESQVDQEQGHAHAITVREADHRTTYQLGRGGMPVARVPMYGKLRFRDRWGKPAEKGVNVGDEWAYRSFIPGGTLAAAIWTFSDISEEDFPDGPPVEMTIEVFRTYKGEIEREVPGSLSVRNPETGQTVEVLRAFRSKEFATKEQFIPRRLEDEKGQPVDLFRDLVADGKVEIWLRCIAPEQYFGAAQADLYLRARYGSFAMNFAKGYLGIWLQMVLVTALGVMLSTFLSSSIALLATLGALLGGLFKSFMSELAAGTVVGGGPFEALYRLITQENVTSDLPAGLTTAVLKDLDMVAQGCLWVMSKLLPEIGGYSFADYVANGFDVCGNVLLQCVVQALAFVVPLCVAGYFCLKLREVGR